MAEEKDLKLAITTYQNIKGMLDDMNFKYMPDDEKLVIKCIVTGDDLPMEITMRVNPDKMLISLYSPLPMAFPEDKRVEGAIAACVANYAMADGSFDYDISDGTMLFRLTCSFRDSLISKELLRYMLLVSAATVDNYNDRFYMLAKGLMDIQGFIAAENN